MPVYLKSADEQKVLLVDGKVATDPACCCGGWNISVSITADSEPFFPGGGELSATFIGVSGSVGGNSFYYRDPPPDGPYSIGVTLLETTFNIGAVININSGLDVWLYFSPTPFDLIAGSFSMDIMGFLEDEGETNGTLSVTITPV